MSMWPKIVPDPRWIDAPPHLLDVHPGTIHTGGLDGRVFGVYDGALWGTSYFEAQLCAFDGEKFLPGPTDIALGSTRSYYATPVGLFAWRRKVAGNIYMDRWTTGIGAAFVNKKDFGAAAGLHITAEQLPNSLCYMGAGRLVWLEYIDPGSEAEKTAGLWVSSDEGENWGTVHIRSDAGAIRHFHGAKVYTNGWLRVWATSGSSATVVLGTGTVVLTRDAAPTTLTHGTEYNTVKELVDYINASVANFAAETCYEQLDDESAAVTDAENLSSTGPSAGGSCLLPANAQVLYESSVAAPLERMLVFTGDDNDESSILICDDIPHFIGNAATWKTRWGLTATAQVRDVPDTAYMLGWNDQSWRLVDCALASGYMIYTADSAVDDNVYRIDLETKERVIIGQAPGEGWRAGVTADGVVFLLQPTIFVDGAYRAGSDDCVRLYALREDLASVVLVKRWRRSDWTAPDGFVIPRGLAQFKGWLWWWFDGAAIREGYEHRAVGRLLPGSPGQQKDDGGWVQCYHAMPGINLLDDPGWSQYAAVIANTRWANGDVDPTDFGVSTSDGPPGSICSLKMSLQNGVPVTMAGMYHDIAENQTWGRSFIVTFAVWLKVSANWPAGANARVELAWGTASVRRTLQDLSAAEKDGEWHLHAMSLYCEPRTTGRLRVYIFAHRGASYTPDAATYTLYIARPHLTFGQRLPTAWLPDARQIVMAQQGIT